MQQPTRVLVVDDDAIVRSAFRSKISQDPSLELVDCVATGEQAVAECRAGQIDVVVMDLRLGLGIDGIEATRQIRASLRPPQVLVVTSFDTDEDLRSAIAAGANGFLLKEDAHDLLLDFVHATAAGDAMTSTSITKRLFTSYTTATTDAVRDEARERVKRLTPREREVATLIGLGHTYEGIGERLFISKSTVKSIISKAMTSTDTDSGAQLACLVVSARLDQVS